MLDTRDFVLRTGVHTFEAAAYLRGRGADTVRVKQLFSNSMEDHQLRNAITSNFDTYRGCAIAIADIEYRGSADHRFASCGRNAEYQRYTVLLCPLPDGGYCQYFGSFHGCYERSADYGNARRWRPSDNGGCAVEQYISQRCKVRLLQVIDQFYAQINAQEEAPQERPEEMQN